MLKNTNLIAVLAISLFTVFGGCISKESTSTANASYPEVKPQVIVDVGNKSSAEITRYVDCDTKVVIYTYNKGLAVLPGNSSTALTDYVYSVCK